MLQEEQVDAALLADVTGFLADCSASASSIDRQRKAPPSFSDDVLVLDTHQLIAETETLLSSLETTAQEQIASNTLSSSDEVTITSDHKYTPKTDAMPAEDRRAYRNVQAAKRRLKYRQKLKDEKKTLESQEIELSGELSRLQSAQEAEKMKYVDRMSLSVWRSIATRQKEKRLEAEQTQRQLRAAVVGRARMIHQMKALLQRPYMLEEKNMLYGEADGGHADGSVLFKTFVSELDAIYAQTDQVMREVNAEVSTKFEYNLTRKVKDGVEYFDSTDATEIPFAFEDTSRAMSLLMMTDPDVLRHNSHAQEPKDTVTVKYIADCQLERDEVAKLKIYSAMRKVKEADRVVFVWRAVTEGQGDLSGHHTDETGWLVSRPQEIGDFPSTVFESYTRFIPIDVGESASKADTDRFAKVVAKSGEEEVNEMMQLLEKMLLGGDQFYTSGHPRYESA
ncbi:hypothetical protein L915_13079 [Phytophthora nicotianae]|uniref:BZIP domain-containing protein n=2 Tax=Phytophthora nicotianae TaxID=4792 RepID=W2GEG5_PHYNI|nr:hypothetical protein L915_13079 [Phytophthora nicotianae]KUG01237.1 hypothetical protein AM587_10006325 [Phytophthora nicotianae]